MPKWDCPGELDMTDGGPAFPFTAKEKGSEGGKATRIGYPGMSLRDWFAGMALQGIISRMPGLPEKLEVDPWNSSIAKLAYALADAMLCVREGTDG